MVMIATVHAKNKVTVTDIFVIMHLLSGWSGINLYWIMIITSSIVLWMMIMMKAVLLVA